MSALGRSDLRELLDAISRDADAFVVL